MEKKKSPGLWLETFFSGKGFYIVLLLSAALIATAVWLMLAENETDVETMSGDVEITITDLPAAERAETVPKAVKPTVQPTLSEPEAATGALESVWSENEEEADLPLYFIWPVSGMIEHGYSMDALLYDRTMADWRTHDGWDIGVALGTQVLAAANGTVTAITQDDLYGTVVEIDHGSGLKSYYANLAAEPTVRVGESVLVGDVIGAVGDTALCEVGEPWHLHFAMKLNGVSADPANWLPER